VSFLAEKIELFQTVLILLPFQVIKKNTVPNKYLTCFYTVFTVGVQCAQYIILRSRISIPSVARRIARRAWGSAGIRAWPRGRWSDAVHRGGHCVHPPPPRRLPPPRGASAAADRPSYWSTKIIRELRLASSI
jgi:hypothetical protein